tara:strand:+ start:627 stop:890 length:264 start_codon:yes stop_codon:yes gene_type:complete
MKLLEQYPDGLDMASFKSHSTLFDSVYNHNFFEGVNGNQVIECKTSEASEWTDCWLIEFDEEMQVHRIYLGGYYPDKKLQRLESEAT